MPQSVLVLLQKPQSPLADQLRQILDQRYGPQGWRDFNQALAAPPPAGPVVVLWDLHGYAAEEAAALGGVLSSDSVGVVVACGRVDPLARRTLAAVGALGLLAQPLGADQVAATLEMARATQERLHALAVERRGLERQWDERLVIEQAKWFLARSRGIGEAEALRQMQRHSRDTNQKLAAVARKLLETHRLFSGGCEEEK